VSLGDETGIANALILPDWFAVQILTIVEEPFLLIEVFLQNQRARFGESVAVEALRVDRRVSALTTFIDGRLLSVAA